MAEILERSNILLDMHGREVKVGNSYYIGNGIYGCIREVLSKGKVAVTPRSFESLADTLARVEREQEIIVQFEPSNYVPF